MLGGELRVKVCCYVMEVSCRRIVAVRGVLWCWCVVVLVCCGVSM